MVRIFKWIDLGVNFYTELCIEPLQISCIYDCVVVFIFILLLHIYLLLSIVQILPNLFFGTSILNNP